MSFSEEQHAFYRDMLDKAASRGRKYNPFGDGSSFVDPDFDDVSDSDLRQEIRSKRWNGETMVNVEDRHS